MTEDQAQPNDSSQSEAEIVRAVRDTIFPFDPMLEGLVALINVLDKTEIGVTLYVHGCVISGMLISVQQHFKLLIKLLSDATMLSGTSNPEGAALFAEFFQPNLESAAKDLEEYKTSQKLPPRPRHIHLRHAQSFVTGLSEPLTFNLWRGRISEVDGWSIGNFGPIPPLEPENV